MAPITRFGRSLSLVQNRFNTSLRRSTRWVRDRRRIRLAAPPATNVEVHDVGHGVVEIRLAAGGRRNVLGRSTISAIEEAVANPSANTRVIVITGEPPDFCAGYDFVEASHGEPLELIAHESNFAALRQSRIPIVAALQGNVIGGGLELALSADIRIASPEVRFAVPASKLGLVYSEGGIRLVVDAMGQSLARAMFLGGLVLNGEAALAAGVVSEMVGREQLRERALALATEMASWSEVASSGNRQILDHVAGRVVVDANELHVESFAHDGQLRRTIHDFVARRSTKSKPLKVEGTTPTQ